MSRQAFPFRLASGCLALLLSALPLWPQATTSLRGTIKDAQGAAIAEAVVTLTNPATAGTRKIVTDTAGGYQFLQISPGDYQVQVERTGFSTLVRSGVTLLVNTPAALDLTMEVGQSNQTVSVEAEASAINAVNASIGNAFNETQVRQLPLITRNVVELLSLQPGVTPNGEVLGARRDQNNITLDGIDVNDQQNAGLNDQYGQGFNSVLPVPLDSVQEFRVTVGGQDAAQGRSSGGQVVLVTKSGTNQLHGSLYEYHRNDATAANNWFNNKSGVPRERLKRNQFGGSLGGPIIKDRVFFFGNFEQRLDRSSVSQTRTLPSQALRQGILTFATNTGGVQTLTPAEIAQVDPQRLGASPAALALLQSYPAGNDPVLGSDSGLNFSGLRFNAPLQFDDKAYVAKLDFRLDQSGNHMVSWRGTLNDSKRDLLSALAQFPGQSPAVELNNSKGFSSTYTAVLRPTLINLLSVGLSRLGLERSGTSGVSLGFESVNTAVNYGARGSGRRIPTWNITDDLTWTKGTHTVQTGINFRIIRNDRFTYSSSFPAYAFSRGTLQGLGSDIIGAVNTFIRQRSGNPSLAITNGPAVTRGMGNLLGVLSSLNYTTQYDASGQPLGQGLPQARSFAVNEYEFYVQDQWRARRDLTLTFGLRYSNYTPPYEQNGLQVSTTVGLDQYLAERVGGQALGIASNALPSARLSYALNGPANDQPSWYKRDNNNFGPRFSFAYSPTDGKLAGVLGKGGVIRGGAALVYDRFGSDLITQFDSLGSVGLATRAGFPQSYNFSNAPRYTGPSSLPAIPAAQPTTFPNTPPPVIAVAGTGLGIMPNLVNPYGIVLNASYARELPGKLTVEVGYAGRLSRKQLLQGDIFTPLTNFKDPKSGQTWRQLATTTRQLSDGGLTGAAVQANPGLVPTLPFAENVFPGLANVYFPGSASANYFYHVYEENGGSDLDGLHTIDRTTSLNGVSSPNCFSAYGCHTFFAVQGSAQPTWMNAGIANYHGGTLSVRRSLSNSFSFDFNYTLAHAIDNGSAAEGGAGQFGGVLQNVFEPGAFRGSSDSDIRHNINANSVFQLPFGRNRRWLANAPGWADQVVGGWQITGLMRYRSGLPAVITGNGLWNTNYWLSSLAVSNGKPYTNSIGLNASGVPSVFAGMSTADAAAAFTDQYPGATGQRAILRMDDLLNFDLSLSKRFRLPFEGHSVQFRAEAFNAFNNVNFLGEASNLDRQGINLSLTSPANFGQFTKAGEPRVFQFALRYEF